MAYGFNVLGLNTHTKDHNSNKVDLSNYYTKEEVDAIATGGSADALKDFAKKSDIPTDYVKPSELNKKLNVIADLETIRSNASKAATAVLPSDLSQKLDKLSDVLLNVLNGNWQPAGNYLTEHQPLAAWAKATDKPSYTAEEVGAISSLEVSKLLDNMKAELLKQLSNNQGSPSEPTKEYKAYYAIVPGSKASELRNNLANLSGDAFTLIDSDELNSGNNEGMLAVLYNKWIPKFNVYDSTLNKWQDEDTYLNSGSESTGFIKLINGEDYILWYNTSATLDLNKTFKIIV